MDFKLVLDANTYNFCSHIMAADAFAAVVIHHLACNKGMTCVRASDGERGIIMHALYNTPLTPWLQDDNWLTTYGVKGADVKQLGYDILRAGNETTFLAPTISGVWLPSYETAKLFQPRDIYVDTFFTYNWAHDLNAANDKIAYVVLRAARKVFIANRNYEKLNPGLKARSKSTAEFTGFPLTSWREHDAVIDAVQKAKPDLVLICGGPHGKVLTNKLGKLMDQPMVVLDAGSGVEAVW